MKTDFHAIFSFLKRLFRYTQAPTIIFVIIIAGLAGYLVYSKETKRIPLKPNVCLQDNKQVQAEKNVYNAVIVKKEKQYTAHIKPAAKEKTVTENQETQAMEELSAEFEEKAIHYTDAEKIRVESKGIDKPGYVAFMCSPEGFRRGIPQVMKEIAEIYLETFPDAQGVTVSWIAGGGVKGQKTFLRDNMP